METTKVDRNKLQSISSQFFIFISIFIIFPCVQLKLNILTCMNFCEVPTIITFSETFPAYLTKLQVHLFYFGKVEIQQFILSLWFEEKIIVLLYVELLHFEVSNKERNHRDL